MKIKSIILKNFRRYKNEVILPVSDLTVLVGKNDIGKTSVLEALDIFFNGSKAINKISIDDLNVDARRSEDKEISIGVEFYDLPNSIVLDSTCKTSLKDEFLLTKNNTLLVMKKYKGDGVKESVFIRANHPTNIACADLLSKKNADLKKIVQTNKMECDNLTSNPELRKTIWGYYSNSLDLQEVDIDVTKEDSKTIWSELEKRLPIYSIFTADRKNEEDDSEVQDPLKETVKQIFREPEIIQELDVVAIKVKEALQKVSDATLQKLKEISPNLADELHPRIGETFDLKWADVFKTVSITGDNDIPLNKRGSGFRRLVLLSFFAAEADRKDAEKTNGVIYAFEEPETSMHSNNQKLLMDSFKKIVKKDGRQVLLTTHSPVIVKTLTEGNSTRPCYENVVLLKEKDGLFSISPLDSAMLPFPSINEVIYLAFDETLEEYHDELYGFLQTNGKICSDCPDNDDKDDYVVKTGIRTLSYNKMGRNKQPNGNARLSLTKYIRNQIHHPENNLNPRFTSAELKESVDCMRKYISDNHLI